jgi:hypothetical protein
MFTIKLQFSEEQPFGKFSTPEEAGEILKRAGYSKRTGPFTENDWMKLNKEGFAEHHATIKELPEPQDISFLPGYVV